MPVTITHSTPADGTFSATGAAAWDATHTVSGLGTMAEQNSNNVNITGGSITGVTGVLTGLTVNSTPTSGGAAGQIMFDTGSVLQESSNLVWDNTNKSLTLSGSTSPIVIVSPSAGTSYGGFRVNRSTEAHARIALGFWGSNNGQLLYGSGTAPFDTYVSRLSSGIIQVGSANDLSNGGLYAATIGVGSNAFLTSRGAANLRLGAADAAAPVAQTLSVQSVVAGTSNTAGANLTITGSQGTGTGAGGSIIFQTAPAGSSGTAQNALANALTIDSTGTVTASLQFASNRFGPNSTVLMDVNADLGSAFTFLAVGGRISAIVGGVGFRTRSSFSYSWSSDADTRSNSDTYLTRRAAANVRLGLADAAAPVAQTLSVQSVVAGTSNTAGANLTITGSQGTGTGAGGSIIFQVAPAGSSGTAQNALVNALALTATGNSIFGVTPAASLYNSSADNIVLPQASNLAAFRFVCASSTAANSGVLSFVKANGDSLSSPTQTASGSTIGVINFQGFNDLGGRQNIAQIFSITEAATSSSSAPGYLAFTTVASGSITATERLRITGSGLITFGGITSSFPALKRSSTVLQVRLADDSAYAPVEASTVRTATAYTVATLPAAGTAGRRAYVTDATAPTWLGALIGGGTVVCPVFDNGTAWVAG